MTAARTMQIPTGATTPEDHVANYWRRRVANALERLENEARRMFQLEAELSNFANEYYEVVGAVSERLAEVENRLASTTSTTASAHLVPEMPDLTESREALEVRKREIKMRYRQLAKEIHPDRASLTMSVGPSATHMQTLNAAYRQGDLAGLLKLEAEMLLADIIESGFKDATAIENALREMERAADTYAEGYRTMLRSPLNELMLRALSARLAGWDWMQAVVKKVERTIEEKERAMIEASIAEISQWREDTQRVVA